MKPEEKLKELIGKSDATTDPRTKERILGEALENLRNLGQKKMQSAQPEPNIGRAIMKSKTMRLAAAAVIVLAVVGGMTFWPERGTDGKKWWLAPPVVWSQEIINTLDTFKCVTCREQIMDITPDGSERMPKTWIKYYTTNDRYRRDYYNKDSLTQIHWYVPDGDDLIQYSILFDSESYTIKKHTGVVSSDSKSDPAASLRSYVEELDGADRLLGTEVIDGYECVGFEISANKYGDYPEGRTDRIWFNVETKLPVRIEKRGLQKSPKSKKKITIIQEQFDYDPGLSADTFVPYTPEGFVFGHPDDIQATKEEN